MCACNIMCVFVCFRENFRQHLQKPDLKQEFVSAWQRDYNSVPDNIREDEETKGELHQRLDVRQSPTLGKKYVLQYFVFFSRTNI